MKRPATTGHDRRPRFHVRQEGSAVILSQGPCGPRVSASSPGEAFEMAIAAADGEDAIIFFERGERRYG